MNYEQALKRLSSCGQAHVLDGWKSLNKKAQAALLAQIAAGIDPAEVKRCRAALALIAAPPHSLRGITTHSTPAFGNSAFMIWL